MKIALQIILLLFATLYFLAGAFDKQERKRVFRLVWAIILVAVIIVTLFLF